jgi:dolichyl-phosphate beta-glucosyltransferase
MPEDGNDIYLTIVIPAYHEEENITPTLQALHSYFDEKPYSVEYIVVDDGSTDSTSERAVKAGAKVTKFDSNLGKGTAVRAGMLAASGKFVLFTDADYPYEISAIENCFREFENGADIAIGSRNLADSNRGNKRLKRIMISRIGNIISRILILPGISDTQAGFKCFTRKAVQKIFPLSLIDGWGFDIEVLFIARKLGCKIREVPVFLIPHESRPSRIQTPLRTAINVFGSIFRVHWNSIAGRYRQRK